MASTGSSSAKLEAEGLKPAPLANRRALLRRATYDLTGLPPTYAEVAAFEADKSPNAWEKVIDRLQASPRYGEKWARHWMDVVRYAEDDYNVSGKDRTEPYKFAYTYRDWLIKSFNQDMPYDMFVRAQLAGDLMDEKVRDKALPGLGMNGLGVWHMMAMAPQIERADDWADKVLMSRPRPFLDLTCGVAARCHDHKYDAIPTKGFLPSGRGVCQLALQGISISGQACRPRLTTRKKKELEEKGEGAQRGGPKGHGARKFPAPHANRKLYGGSCGAWVVRRSRHRLDRITNQYKLDSELLERWVRFLKKAPLNYSYLKNWQAMVERGGKLDEAKQLAREFYQLADGIDKEKAKIKQENETLLAKITDPNAKELFDPLPNDKKRTIKSFLLDLKGIPQEKGQLWTDLFDFELPDPSKVGDGADAFSFGKGRPPDCSSSPIMLSRNAYQRIGPRNSRA